MWPTGKEFACARLVCPWLAAALVCSGLFPPSPNPPLVDLHFHWEGKADLDRLVADAAAQGVKLGITGEGGAGWGLSDDASLARFLGRLEGKPVFRGLQVYTLDWPRRYSPATLAGLDYVAADALLFPDREGKVIALWNPEVVFPDPQDFMDRYVAYNLKVLSGPINIWSNPTYLPESLQARYDELWTPARADALISAAVTNQVAIEINSRYRIPSASLIRRARQAGARFTFGSNRHDDEPGDLEYCVRMYRECGLTAEDLYLPTGVRVR